MTPLLADGGRAAATWRRSGESALSVRWDFGGGRSLLLLANFGPQPTTIPTPAGLAPASAWQLGEVTFGDASTTLGGFSLSVHSHAG